MNTIPHRPVFHYTAPTNWINDPNGLAFHDGRYHLHFQYNPNGSKWGDIHWGHASSADLVSWRDEPIALAPSPGDDAGGCFSGCHALVDGVHTLYYTGYTAERQVQCVATSSDLRHWTKQPQRTLATPPAGVEGHDFRDPYVFRHDGRWYMVVGASRDHEQGQALLYRSDDGITWEDRGALYTSPSDRHGRMWECPNFFPIGDRWVLTVSLWLGLGVHAFVGRFEHERFVPEWDGPLDVDAGAFAHLTMQGPDGRTLQWAWMNEQREQAAIDADGWAGAMTVPRELSIDAHGRLNLRPVAEIARLRGEPVARVTGLRGSGEHVRFSGAVLDIEARFAGRDRGKVGLMLRTSADGRETTRIVYWQDARRLSIERERSSLSPQVRHQDVHAHLALAPDEALNLRVLLDGSVLEVYANDRLCLSTRVYPTLPDSLQASAFSDGPATLDLRAWTMGPILPAERPVLSAG
ncbi:glycoside hydrolase family 32 protein [Leptothrix discophora]|uniref:beta-fructofuranosidase n=1 Tax=Leptothrix discophora TaxID=89 RepID=A0ABT9G149_LEPDI|nr:glycoside hydrolase family 32 protein [Leptothrix discophora]MDP4300202.1 glycoside hydrolase family 32 protein [Leptothrix discophora]